jgi:hypothetical protein
MSFKLFLQGVAMKIIHQKGGDTIIVFGHNESLHAYIAIQWLSKHYPLGINGNKVIESLKDNITPSIPATHHICGRCAMEIDLKKELPQLEEVQGIKFYTHKVCPVLKTNRP